jgi:hypothetical protein
VLFDGTFENESGWKKTLRAGLMAWNSLCRRMPMLDGKLPQKCHAKSGVVQKWVSRSATERHPQCWTSQAREIAAQLLSAP